MELESSSPYPQVSAICSYPEPNPSSPHKPFQLPEDPSYYYHPVYVLVSLLASFPQAFPPTPCTHLYPPPYAPHTLPVSFVSILPPAQYWVRCTDHSAPRYAKVIQARKYIACINGILQSKGIRKERKLNICNEFIKGSLLYVFETWRLTENNKRRVEATAMEGLRRSSRISRRERIRNVIIRQQIGLEGTIIKETEQNQLIWHGHVQRTAEGRLPKITLEWMSKQKRARERPKINWMEGIRKAMNERNLNEGQWKDRKQWSLVVGQRRKTF
jgi:hypothetical protein